jgi:deazaflavin-dependent oxidoreductase (nitroreductase family)
VDGDPDTVGASLDALGSEDYLYLTTTGRVSGNPHRIEIWFALSGATAYLLSGGGERSDWVRNLRANPSVGVRIRDRHLTATARVVEPATDEDALARRLVVDKYARGYSGDLTAWRASALPVALDLDEGS